jgi:Domain of unknown function (DUF4129)
MSTEAFERTNWGWQLYLLQKRAGEWVEYQLSRLQANQPDSSPKWSIDGTLLEKVLKFTFWVLVALFVVWVVWQLWREFSPYINSWLNKTNNIDISRSKNTEAPVSLAIWLERSQQLYRQGNYREACRCLYLALLLRLHETKILPQQSSRTDGEYLQLLRSNVTPMQPYETLITTHEQLCFSDGQILAENYQQCQQAYDEIQGSAD